LASTLSLALPRARVILGQAALGSSWAIRRRTCRTRRGDAQSERVPISDGTILKEIVSAKECGARSQARDEDKAVGYHNMQSF
jgi:hypothetical protein